jgi:outer membrane protein OmpA-like peptidoglycan-associated protein
VSNWASTLSRAPRTSGRTTTASGAGTLAGECAAAASAVTGLEQTTGSNFGSRRVILLYAPNLAGLPRAGELNGDDLIVITPFLPSAAAASAVQASLIDAGAIQASVLGPETTSAQLDHLVGAGLGQRVMITEDLSGAALFGNDSAVLRPGAVRVLEPLLVPLHRPGASAVVNGYASTTGTRKRNVRLSYARAAAVAGFLEAHGVAASDVIVVGHGASDLVAAGPAAANRRVVVVIEEPPAGSS